jgi:ribokinase
MIFEPEPLEAVVLGVAAMDLVARVERLPKPDELVLASSFEHCPGGAGANAAVAIARMGHRTGFFGPLGDDANALTLIAAFDQENVDFQACPRVKNDPQAACFITVDSRGDRTIVALGGAGRIDRPEELDLSYIKQGRALLVSDYGGAVAQTAMQAARQNSAKIFFGPGGIVAARGLEALDPLLPMVDVLILSRSEAEMLLPGYNPEKAALILGEKFSGTAIITLGVGGALLFDQGHLTHLPAVPVSEVIDSTGAGDAFTAALICGYLEDRPWAESVRLGNAAAGLKLGRMGARAGLPQRAALDEFLKRAAG